jgi:hypothetical protein
MPKKAGRKYAIKSAALGTWGVGVAWTIAAVGRGLTGGKQVKDDNARLLQHVGAELLRRGDVSEARRALEASLEYEYDEDVHQWLQANPAEGTALPDSEGEAGTKRKKRFRRR